MAIEDEDAWAVNHGQAWRALGTPRLPTNDGRKWVMAVFFIDA